MAGNAEEEDLTWFKIKNYDFIKELTLGDFLYELISRKFIYETSLMLNFDFFMGDEEVAAAEYIFNGKPEVRDIVLKSSDRIIKQLNAGDIDSAYHLINNQYSSLPGEVLKARNVEFNDRLADLKIPNENNIYASINIREFTDEQLISEFQALLTTWRKVYGIQAPKIRKTNPLAVSNILKIFDYRIIPITDIYIWGNLNSKEIKPKLVEKKFYNASGYNYVIDSESYRRTVKVFHKNVFEAGYIEDMSNTVLYNSHLRNATISEIMANPDDYYILNS